MLTPSSANDPYRVMVVDDSAVIRGLMTRILESDNQIKVLTAAGNGQMAVSALDRYNPEVVLIDLEMPVMDGLTAIPQLLKKNPNLKIIVVSSLSQKGAKASIDALEAGAADYLPKPEAAREFNGESNFKREIIEKVRAMGMAARRGISVSGRQLTPPSPRAATPGASPASPPPKSLWPGKVALRVASPDIPDVIAIGSSTGGPQALQVLFDGLVKRGPLRQPVIITQHMPPNFTTILAEHLAKQTGWQVKEGKEGDEIRPGCVYIAPGGFHMLIESKGASKFIKIDSGPQENFCKPAVDPMLRSLTKAYGRKILTVILTGMGQDGMKGGQVVVETGGNVIAQDEATSVVWGMPGAAATAGICCAVLPLPDIAGKILQMAGK